MKHFGKKMFKAGLSDKAVARPRVTWYMLSHFPVFEPAAMMLSSKSLANVTNAVREDYVELER